MLSHESAITLWIRLPTQSHLPGYPSSPTTLHYSLFSTPHFISPPGPSPLSRTLTYLLSSVHPFTGRKFLQGACHLPASEGNEKRRDRTFTDWEYYRKTRVWGQICKVLLTEKPQQYVCAVAPPRGRHLHAAALPSHESHLSHWSHTYQIQIKQIFIYYILGIYRLFIHILDIFTFIKCILLLIDQRMVI